MEEQLKEYIVTLHRHEDLEGFYEDMETPGGNLYIPDRGVNVSVRRPISRNTHYLLTEEEVEILRNDPRVLAVTDNTIERVRKLLYIDESSSWDKSDYPTQSSDNRNWGILRCERGEQILGWGTDNVSTQSGSVTITSTGKNVDVVILDGLVNREHTEFLDSSGTTSRVKYHNWYQHNQEVTGGTVGTYPTPNVSEQDNYYCNHATHVAGTVAGRTYGWARDANIYSISAVGYQFIYDLYQQSEVNSVYGTKFSNWNDYTDGNTYPYDYIRLFHKNKLINPETGIKNPTIVNSSFAISALISRSSIQSIKYKNQTYTGPFLDSDLESYELPYYTSTQVQIDLWDQSILADIVDMLNEGVILVGAAGNDQIKIVSDNDTVNYNNSIITSNSTEYFYSRGATNVAASNTICVGAVGVLQNEVKATYSNNGNRIDVFAPGTWIMSSVTGGQRFGGQPPGFVVQETVSHPKDSNYKVMKYRGTSMATPQVTGVLACILENNPRMNQQDCLDYIIKNGTLDQMYDSGSDILFDLESLRGASNRYLYFKKQRETSGYVTAQLTNNVRKSSGMMFPRRRHI